MVRDAQRKADVRRHFEQTTEQQLRGLGGHYGRMAYAGYVLDVCRFPANAKVLDLGCGDGMSMAEIHRLRPDLALFGLDISENQVATARQRVPSASFAVSDARDGIGFEGVHLDAVYTFSFAQYVSAGELLGINHALRPRLVGGGIFHLSIPDRTKKAAYAMVNQLNRKGPAIWRYAYGILIALAKAGNNRYAKLGRWHHPFGIGELHADMFDVTIRRPGDVWYRFDLVLRPK